MSFDTFADSFMDKIKNLLSSDQRDIEGKKIGILKKDVPRVGDIYVRDTGIFESEVGEAGDIKIFGANGEGFGESSDVLSLGIFNSEVGSVGNIYSPDIGIKDSSVERTGLIKSRTTAVSDSDIGHIEKIETKGTGVNNSSIEILENITAGENGINESKVEEIGSVRTNGYSIWNSTVDKIDSITSRDTAVLDSEVKSINHISSRNVGLKRSEIGYISHLNSNLKGVISSEVDKIDDLYSGVLGIKDSFVDYIGQLKAGVSGIENSAVKRVDEIRSGGVGIDNSDVGVAGNIYARDIGVKDVENLEIYGDIIKNGKESERFTAFVNAKNIYAVNDRIKADDLSKNTYSGLVAANNFDVLHKSDTITVITGDNSEGTVNFNGDWNALKQLMIEDRGSLKYLQAFPVTEGEFESVDELLEYNDELGDKLETNPDLKDIGRGMRYLSHFNPAKDIPVNMDHYGQMIDKLVKDYERMGKKKVSDFGKLLNKVERIVYEELKESLDTSNPEHKFGKDLYEIGENLKYLDFLEKEDVKEFLTGRKDEEIVKDSLKDEIEFFDQDSPYRKKAEKLIEDYSKELSKLFYRAEKTGITPSLKIIKELKGSEGQRKNTGYMKEIDDEYIEETMQRDLENKIREYTKQGFEKLGLEQAKNVYRDIMGENREELEREELMIVKARRKYDKNSETAEKLLRLKNDIYKEEENKKWIEKTGIEREKLVDFSTGYREVTTNSEKFEIAKIDVEEKMRTLLKKYCERTNENYTAENLDDFENLRDEIVPPDNDKEAQRIYKTIFKDKLNEYYSLEDKKNSIPEKIKVETASPYESVLMGNHFPNSCMAVGKNKGWGAIGNAADINKQVLYAYDRDENVVGRVLTAVTEDENLTYFKIYSNTEAKIDPVLEKAVEEYAENLGLDVVHRDKNVETLVAEEFYDSGI